MKIRALSLGLLLGLMPLSVQALNYEVIPLVSNLPNIAPTTDPNLVNPWGLFFVPNGNFWVADNGSDLSTLYQPNGTIVNFIINVLSAPTGAILNSSATKFIITKGLNSGPARFLFATEQGTILGFNTTVDPLNAIIAVDNTASNAFYKGLATASTCCQECLLFATDFHNAKIDVFDSTFKQLFSLKDPTIPVGYAPFNIHNINDLLYVTYAKQQAPDNKDDEPGVGHGYIDIFTAEGTLKQRLVSQGNLNSPWGLALAPNNFGEFSQALLVGNFGDGLINAYNPLTGQFLGQLTDSLGNPIVIDGLWSLEFNADGTLYFTAGPNGETDGLVGIIMPLP